jgi:hypothetical protein
VVHIVLHCVCAIIMRYIVLHHVMCYVVHIVLHCVLCMLSVEPPLTARKQNCLLWNGNVFGGGVKVCFHLTLFGVGVWPVYLHVTQVGVVGVASVPGGASVCACTPLVWGCGQCMCLLVTPEEVRHVSRNADSACPFCIAMMTKRVTLSQHLVTHVVPPLL